MTLQLPIPSLVKQFLHFSKIPPAFIHPNVIQILMGCSVLDALYQLDLSLQEVLFVYMIKMSPKKCFSLSAHISSLQFVTKLPSPNKGWAKDHVLVFSPWNGSTEGPYKLFKLTRSLEIPSTEHSCNVYTLHTYVFVDLLNICSVCVGKEKQDHLVEWVEKQSFTPTSCSRLTRKNGITTCCLQRRT